MVIEDASDFIRFYHANMRDYDDLDITAVVAATRNRSSKDANGSRILACVSIPDPHRVRTMFGGTRTVNASGEQEDTGTVHLAVAMPEPCERSTAHMDLAPLSDLYHVLLPHASCLMPHASCLMPHAPYLILHTPYPIPHS